MCLFTGFRFRLHLFPVTSFLWHTCLLVFCFGQVIEWVVTIEEKDFLLEISVQLNLPERTFPDLNWLSFVWLINRWLGGSTTVEFVAQTYNNDMTIRFLFSSISSFIYHTVMTNDEYQIQRFRMDLQFVEWLWEKLEAVKFCKSDKKLFLSRSF